MSRFGIIRFKIKLDEIDIWRVFKIRAYSTLQELHEVIQIVMGWDDSHLYQFNISGERILEEDPEFETPESRYTLETTLHKIFTKKGQICEYIYDFGDYWKHNLEVEKVYKYTFQDIGRDVMNGGHKEFPFCIEGVKKCPPEDVGSTEGYFEFIESMRTKDNDYERNVEWFGSHYDEDEFDLKSINKQLSKLR